MQTLKSTELEFYSIKKIVADLIRKNPVYQIDGKNDRYLVAEVQREAGQFVFSDSVTRRAREIRNILKQNAANQIISKI